MTDNELKNLCDMIRNADASLDEYRILRHALDDAYMKEKIAMLQMQPEPVAILCPVCDNRTDVHHFQWEAITCQTCENMVQRSRWKLWQDPDMELPF